MNNSIRTQWDDMLYRGIMPLFELELKNDEYLLVNISLTDCNQFIEFSFDTDNKKTWFSGETKTIRDGLYRVEIDPCFDSLDHYLEFIHGELIEGFIIPNNLMID